MKLFSLFTYIHFISLIREKNRDHSFHEWSKWNWYWICANERRFVCFFFIIFFFLLNFLSLQSFIRKWCVWCILFIGNNWYSTVIRVYDLGLIRYSIQTCIVHTPVIAMLQLFRSGSLSVVDYVKKRIRLLFDYSLWLKAKELKLVTKSTKVRWIGPFFILFLSVSLHCLFYFSRSSVTYRLHKQQTQNLHTYGSHNVMTPGSQLHSDCVFNRDSCDLYKNMI